jgi:hypothetical protein
MSGLGVSYLPPTENVAIFDSSLFNRNDETLTYGEMLTKFLTFPVAQGPESLEDTSIYGSLTIENDGDRINLSTPAYTSVVIGDNTTLPDGTPSDSVFIGNKAGENITSTAFGCVAVGQDSFSNTTNISSAITEFYNTAIGSSCLNKATNQFNDTLSNTAVGYSCLSQLERGSNNTAIGVQAGGFGASNNFDNGSLNTFLGAKTGCLDSIGTLTHSTAVGAEAIISDNNQIQLGTASDYVNIPNLIKFPSGQTQINSATATFNEATTSASVSYTNTKYYDSTINFSSNQNTTITIIPPQAGNYLKIYNDCQFFAVLNIDGVKTFTGEWGNGDPTIRLNANSWSLLYAINSTSWMVMDRSSDQVFDTIPITTTTNYELHYNFLNCYLQLSPDASTGRNVTIPSPTAIFSRNKFMRIANASSSFPLTIVSTGINFSGKFGSGTTTYTIPANSSVELLSNGTNWLVIDRSGNQTYYFNGNGIINDWTLNNQYLNSLVEFVASDNAINTNPTFNITASITAGSNLLVVSFTAGSIPVGSSITTGGRTYYIISQDYTAGGSSGGTGSYRLSGYFTTAVASGTLSVKPSSNVANGGTITITTSTSNISTANILTAGAGTIDAGAQLTVQTLPTNISNTIERIGSTGTTGTYLFSAQNSANTTGRVFYSTSATTLLLPVPSTSNLGQTITIKNSSYAPVNITTSARTAIFTGKYSASYVITSSTLDTAVVPAKNHLLRAQQQGVFRSDGTNWEVVEGTSFEGTRAFFVNSVTSSSQIDGTIASVPFSPLYTNTSCLYGLVSNAGIGSGAYAVNMYPFPITVQITFNCLWLSPAVSPVTNIIPQRRIGIQYNGVSSTGTLYLNTNIGSSSIIPENTSIVSGVNTVYSLTATTILQMVSGVITLNPGDQIGVITTKYNGTNSPAGLEGVSGFVYINRIA